ncbi:hypothetical protein H5410_016344 [Solanum commersonii]|uniref:Uncharacterized protein n=1 Tax=Solanum commersonii TaxID=4109 RepID=A0A9J5ZWB5_SOLCO|nr:hypothetical protein H5410_016344 [Solanum commersonii]
MSKLDLYNSGESHYILTIQEKVDIDSPTKPIDSQSAKRSASIEEDVIILQFGSFELVEVSALKKTTNRFKVDDFSNKESLDIKSSANQLRQCESIKSNTKLKNIKCFITKVPSTYSLKSERAYRDVNLYKSDEMRSLLASLSPRLKDKIHHLFEGMINQVLSGDRLETTKCFPKILDIKYISRRSTSSYIREIRY